MVAHRVGAKHVRFELAAAYQSDAAVIEDVTLAEPPQLHAVMLSADSDSDCPLKPASLTAVPAPWELEFSWGWAPGAGRARGRPISPG